MALIKLHILKWALENISDKNEYHQLPICRCLFCLAPLAWKIHVVAYVYGAYAIIENLSSCHSHKCYSLRPKI